MLQTLVTRAYEVSEVKPGQLMFARSSFIANSIFLAFMALVAHAGLLAAVGLMIIIVGNLLVLIARFLQQDR